MGQAAEAKAEPESVGKGIGGFAAREGEDGGNGAEIFFFVAR